MSGGDYFGSSDAVSRKLLHNAMTTVMMIASMTTLGRLTKFHTARTGGKRLLADCQVIPLFSDDMATMAVAGACNERVLTVDRASHSGERV